MTVPSECNATMSTWACQVYQKGYSPWQRAMDLWQLHTARSELAVYIVIVNACTGMRRCVELLLAGASTAYVLILVLAWMVQGKQAYILHTQEERNSHPAPTDREEHVRVSQNRQK